MKQIYMITYPNGKIYIGKDLTGTLTYFGTVDSKYVEMDFSDEQKKCFIIKKEILWESESTSDYEVNRKEVEYIRLYKSNMPSIGYNKWPKSQSGQSNARFNLTTRPVTPCAWILAHKARQSRVAG